MLRLFWNAVWSLNSYILFFGNVGHVWLTSCYVQIDMFYSDGQTQIAIGI